MDATDAVVVILVMGAAIAILVMDAAVAILVAVTLVAATLVAATAVESCWVSAVSSPLAFVRVWPSCYRAAIEAEESIIAAHHHHLLAHIINAGY